MKQFSLKYDELIIREDIAEETFKPEQMFFLNHEEAF